MCLPGGSRDGQLVLSLAAGQLGLDLLTTSIMVMARGVDPSWLALEIEPVRAVVQVTLFLPCFSFLFSSSVSCVLPRDVSYCLKTHLQSSPYWQPTPAPRWPVSTSSQACHPDFWPPSELDARHLPLALIYKFHAPIVNNSLIQKLLGKTGERQLVSAAAAWFSNFLLPRCKMTRAPMVRWLPRFPHTRLVVCEPARWRSQPWMTT
jgi:hypothetical protein